MAEKKLNKSTATKELVRQTSKSSGYYIYEVEDVIEHFIAHVQNELRDKGIVKIDGIGVIKRTDLKVKSFYKIKDEVRDSEYNAVKLSIKTDEAMRKTLKEKSNATATEQRLESVSDCQQPEN